MPFYSQFTKDHLIIAHRGVRSEAPENTLLAFEKGLGRTDGFEIDVQLTRDGVPVVIHDALLTRTTDILSHPTLFTCKQWKVQQFSLDELRLLDAGSWFLDQDPFGLLEEAQIDINALHEKMPQKIPTLKEVLLFAKEHHYPLNIELKYDEHISEFKPLVEQTLRVIQEIGYASKIIISSFCHEALAYMKTLDPTLPLAALIEDEIPTEDIVGYLQDLGAEALHIDHELVEKLPLDALKKANIPVCVFTVNDARYIEMLFDLGIKGVFSDFAA